MQSNFASTLEKLANLEKQSNFASLQQQLFQSSQPSQPSSGTSKHPPMAGSAPVSQSNASLESALDAAVTDSKDVGAMQSAKQRRAPLANMFQRPKQPVERNKDKWNRRGSGEGSTGTVEHVQQEGGADEGQSPQGLLKSRWLLNVVSGNIPTGIKNKFPGIFQRIISHTFLKFYIIYY